MSVVLLSVSLLLLIECNFSSHANTGFFVRNYNQFGMFNIKMIFSDCAFGGRHYSSYSGSGRHFSVFSRNSEASPSEFQENTREMFPLYYMN